MSAQANPSLEPRPRDFGARFGRRRVPTLGLRQRRRHLHEQDGILVDRQDRRDGEQQQQHAAGDHPLRPEFLEQALNTMLRRRDVNTRISGKDVFPMAGEYTATVMQKGVMPLASASRNATVVSRRP